MIPYFTTAFGNAASRSHIFGWTADRAVTHAREEIARLIGADPREIVFTSGATESNNLAIKGAFEYADRPDAEFITVATEHSSVIDVSRYLESRGHKVTRLGVAPDGTINFGELVSAITDKTLMVSVMAANNEIGVLQDVAGIGRMCRDREILFHSDATQAAGKIPLNPEAMNIDLMSLSAHKMYGPKGIGALYVRRKPPRTRLSMQMHGGGHERGMRSGTLNVPGIVGFAKAAEICRADMAAETETITALRERLIDGLLRIDGARLNGHRIKRVPGNANLSFAGIPGEALLAGLDDIAVSSGSACNSASIEPSHVLSALGISNAEAFASLRIGLGRFNTVEEVDYCISRVTETVNALKQGKGKMVVVAAS